MLEVKRQLTNTRTLTKTTGHLKRINTVTDKKSNAQA